MRKKPIKTLSYDSLGYAKYHSYIIGYSDLYEHFSVARGDHPHDPDGWTEWLGNFKTEAEAMEDIRKRRKLDILQELSEL